ncbi:hypothetical protein D9758_007140 [Tetrapyrgos nigripes]|uniref:F-box domain-containing protein n=1 Tax=Tetrapyrgos nigripes TaxID=182062 RepID=A0A8H5GDS6_9AGAR|nr:hypothetical protein D9758_007140 [Tetrapyrgos nigripes]
MAVLGDLSAELIILILTHVPFRDVFSFQLTSRSFHTVISESTELQYHILLQTSGMLDNCNSSLPLRTRYEMLREREKSWLLLQPRFTRRISVGHSAVVPYELLGDVYMVSDGSKATISTFTLPSDAGDPVSSSRKLHVGDFDQGRIIDFAVAPEQDLLVLVTSDSDTPTGALNLQIHCIQRTTYKRHPLSVAGPISLSFDVPCSCAHAAVAGDLIALTFQSGDSEDDQVFLLNWKRSTVLAEMKSPTHLHGNAIFISRDILLVPNYTGLSYTGPSIQLWRIPEPSTKRVVLTTPNLTLNLPAYHPEVEVHEFLCRNSDNSSSQRPFYSDPDQSIVLFQLFTLSEPEPSSIELVFFVHRKVFLELLSAHENQPSSDSVVDHNSMHVLPWLSWGPPNTRFFHPTWYDQSSHTDWIVTAYGQRYVFLDLRYRTQEGTPVVVFDFNENTVKRVRNALEKAQTQDPPSLDIALLDVSIPTSIKGPESDGDPALARQRIGWCWKNRPGEDSGRNVPWGDQVLSQIFSEHVDGDLPYVMLCSEKLYDFTGTMMDDERVLGARSGEFHAGVDNLEVLWFG